MFSYLVKWLGSVFFNIILNIYFICKNFPNIKSVAYSFNEDLYKNYIEV